MLSAPPTVARWWTLTAYHKKLPSIKLVVGSGRQSSISFAPKFLTVAPTSLHKSLEIHKKDLLVAAQEKTGKKMKYWSVIWFSVF